MWLNAVIYDCGTPPTTFCVAYVIADHLNKTTGDAWPSMERIAERLCVSPKTVQRCVRQLERSGWLSVKRSTGRKRSNRYRPNFPSEPAEHGSDTDKSKLKTGQLCPENLDADVPQSYLENLSITYLEEAAGKGPSVMRDQGTYEVRLAQRLGPNGTAILEKLAAESAGALTNLCLAEKKGFLSDQQLMAVISRYQIFP